MQYLEILDFSSMIKNFRDKHDILIDYDSELLLKILNKSSIPTQKADNRELFIDANWKENLRNKDNITSPDNSNLQGILSEIFPEKKILIKDNNDGSQTITLS